MSNTGARAKGFIEAASTWKSGFIEAPSTWSTEGSHSTLFTFAQVLSEVDFFCSDLSLFNALRSPDMLWGAVSGRTECCLLVLCLAHVTPQWIKSAETDYLFNVLMQALQAPNWTAFPAKSQTLG